MPRLAKQKTETGRYVHYITPRFQDRPLDQIKLIDLEAFQTELLKKKLSPKTISHILSLIRRIYNKMADWELYDGRLPTTRMKMPKFDNKRVRFLYPSEAAQVMETLKGIDLTWWQMSALSLNAGLRLGEILKLTWSDVDLESLNMHIRDAKNGTRIAIINETLVKIFHAMAKGKSSDPVFTVTVDTGRRPSSVSKVFTAVVNGLGLNDDQSDRRQRVVFHTLRHTFTSWLAIKGTPLYMISKLMGHSNIEMTKRDVAALFLEGLIFFFFKILGLVFSMVIIMTFLGVLALALWLLGLALTGLGFNLDVNFSAYTPNIWPWVRPAASVGWG